MRTDRLLIIAAALVLSIAGLAAARVALAAQAPLGTVVGALVQGDDVRTGDQTIQPGETVEDIVVVGGDLRVLGVVEGTAVVVGGDLILERSGGVRGNAVITGGQLLNRGGSIDGELRIVDMAGTSVEREIERAVERGVAAAEAEAARELEREERREGRGWFRAIGEGLAGVISTLALGLVLAGIGAVLVFYGRPYLETVSDTARASTLRAGVVGLAATFLIVPVFLVLLVTLVVSIIGIPLLLAMPLYPLVVVAAFGFGLLGTSHAIGERTAEQRAERFDSLARNSYTYLFTGLGMLLAPLIAGYLLKMTGFLGFAGTLILVVGYSALWVSSTVGLGAVLLSRAGTRRSFAGDPPPSMLETDGFLENDELDVETRV